MRICLDAGHYKGYNAGAVKGYYEGDIVWKITNYQKKYLEEYEGVTVVLTRSDISKDLSLANRGAKSKGCDLFLSNHTNAVTTESVDRAVVIYPFDNINNSKALADKLASVINKTIGAKQNYQLMQKTLPNRKQDYYGVMRSARSAGCPRYYILEHGFHTNKAICNWLLVDSNLDKLAKAEVEVIAAYYGLKKKSSSTNTSSSTSYLVEINTSVLNVRKGAGTSYPVTTQVKKGQVYTIVEEKNGWGRLKSGAGWISLKYTKKK